VSCDRLRSLVCIRTPGGSAPTTPREPSLSSGSPEGGEALEFARLVARAGPLTSSDTPRSGSYSLAKSLRKSVGPGCSQGRAGAHLIVLSANRHLVTTDQNKSAGGRARKATVAAPGLSLKKNYEAGEQIAGKYLLKQKLGEGGMGAVWRAYNETLDVDVAVKLIRAEEVDSVEGGAHLGDRLLQEARAAARLGHPAIARVFDFGTTDRGDPFIVMELLKGEDLADTLARRGQIAATKAVATLLPIAHALEAAHSQGIVHRDIKPENIFLARSADGRVQPKLVDFGVAKIDRAKNHRLTQTGAMLGSPIYMSPEQARGDDVDRQADVWALCVVLYEMITGRPPFEGKNYNALLFSIISDEPVSITAFGAGDDELWEVVRRGLAKDPAQRWPSMQLLGASLARWSLARNVLEDITGASITAQWLRRMQSGADVLASMMPPADEADRDTPTERLRVSPAQMIPARASTGFGKTVHRVSARRLFEDRAVRVAALSAGLGVLLVGALSFRALSDVDSHDEAASVAVQGESAAASRPEQNPEARPLQADQAAVALALSQLVQPAASAPPQASHSGGSESAAAAQPAPSNSFALASEPPTKPKRARAVRKPVKRPAAAPPPKKPRLKNPFK
jgi:eukaryotic-like serine/threonine-protein kinase